MFERVDFQNGDLAELNLGDKRESFCLNLPSVYVSLCKWLLDIKIHAHLKRLNANMTIHPKIQTHTRAQPLTHTIAYTIGVHINTVKIDGAGDGEACVCDPANWSQVTAAAAVNCTDSTTAVTSSS